MKSEERALRGLGRLRRFGGALGGDGKLAVNVEVSAHKFSASAREAITAAGGSATEL